MSRTTHSLKDEIDALEARWKKNYDDLMQPRRDGRYKCLAERCETICNSIDEVKGHMEHCGQAISRRAHLLQEKLGDLKHLDPNVKDDSSAAVRQRFRGRQARSQKQRDDDDRILDLAIEGVGIEIGKLQSELANLKSQRVRTNPAVKRS